MVLDAPLQEKNWHSGKNSMEGHHDDWGAEGQGKQEDGETLGYLTLRRKGQGSRSNLIAA